MVPKQRFPWVSVSAVVAVVVVGVVVWLQIPQSPINPQQRASLPLLGFTKLDPSRTPEILAEQLAAYDPTPLFLPTAMNCSQTAFLIDEQRNTEGPFAPLKTFFIFPEGDVGLNFPPIVAVPTSSVQGLDMADQRETPLFLGRMNSVGKKLPSRVGYMEALEAGSGRVVLSLPLDAADGPQGDWQPMELLGAVSRFGQAGSLVVTVSSGSDDVDDYFCSQLTQVIRIGARLPPGFYVFRIGP